MSIASLRRQWWIAGLLSVALVGALGASFSGRGAAQSTSPAATLRFVHAIAGGGPVDVLLDGNPIAKDLAFGKSTSYASLPSGDHGIKVMQAGQDQGQALINQTITVAGGGAYNFIIGSQNNQYQAQLLQVNLNAVPVGQARYRIIQASPDLGNVTLQLGDTSGGSTNANAASGANANGATGANGAANGAPGFLADNGYQQVASGVYTLHVLNAGTTQDVFSSPSITLDSGSVYDLVVIGQNADHTLAILPLVTNVFAPCGQALGVGKPTDACVRFIHASPDAGAVDILVDGTVVVKSISYGTVTQFTAVSSADHKIQVVPTGQAASAAVLDQTVTFSTGQAYQFAVDGLKANTGDTGLHLHQDQIDLTPLPAGQARVRLIHAVPGGGDATITTAQGTALFDKVSFNSATSYALVNAGSYDLQVQIGQSGNQSPTTINAKGTMFKEGMVYDLFLIGRSTDNSEQVLVATAQASVRQGAQGTPVSIASPVPATQATPVAAVSVTAITNTVVGTPVGTAAASPIMMTATTTPTP